MASSPSRSCCSLAACLVVVLLASSPPSGVVAARASAGGCTNITEGFTAVSLGDGNFELQWPYDVASGERYRFDGIVRQLWVLASDEPLLDLGYDYSSGVWQLEGYGYVPSGTTGVSIMQLFGAGERATTLMLHVYGGALRYYDQQTVEDGICHRWFRLNVVHDVGASSLTVFVDGVRKLRAAGRGGVSHYFKFGVYAQRSPYSCMESRWRHVRILWKD